MPSPDKKSIEWVKLPATFESPGTYNKASDEFRFIFATPKRYQDPHINALLARIGNYGVFFFVPCTPEQAEVMLQQKDTGTLPRLPIDRAAGPGELASSLVPVEVMAEVLGVDPRTVQLDAEKGILVRTAHGQYDALASCATLRKAWKEAQNGQTDAYNDEKVREIRIKRQEREAKLAERMGKLLNADRTRQVYEAVEAEERNALLNMPKKLSVELDMVSGTEAEVKLNDWIRRHLKTFSSWDGIMAMVRNIAQTKTPEKPQKQEKKKKKKQRQ